MLQYVAETMSSNAAGTGSMIELILMYIVLGGAALVGMWKTFVKAGKPGWAAIIPIYNNIVMLQIIGKPIWWVILLFVPIVNIAVSVMILHELSKAFGRGIGFTLLILFVPFVAFPILGFGQDQYRKPSTTDPLVTLPTPPQAA